jgi:protein-lysine N-methyltransferase EEF2KMT
MFTNKRVLELGAGIGLSAVCLHRAAKHKQIEAPSAIYMTDYHERVLENSAENMELNGLRVARSWTDDAPTPQADVFVDKLDWLAVTPDQIARYSPDWLLGADIIYDPEVMAALLHVVQLSFEHNPALRCLFVVTKRNEKTFELFLNECSRHCVASRNVTSECPVPDAFYSIKDRSGIMLFELTSASKS